VMTQDAQKTIAGYLADMSALLSHIESSVKRQLGAQDVDRTPAAHRVVSDLHRTVQAQQKSVKDRLDAFEPGGAEGAKSAASNLLGAIVGFYDKLRSDTVSRMLRDDYTALSLASICYGMLHTSALALNDEETAQLAIDNQAEINRLIIELSRIVPEAVVADLSSEHSETDAFAAGQAAMNIRNAWTVETTNV